MKSFAFFQKSWKKKFTLFFLTVILLSGICFQSYLAPTIYFHQISNQLYQDFLQSNELDLSFCLANHTPRNQFLPSYDKAVYSNPKDIFYQKKLSSLSGKYLSPPNRKLYKLLADYYNRQSPCEKYLYLENPFSPTNGAHITIPVLLSEYPIRQKKDIDTYLSILKELPHYFDSLITYCNDAKKQGILFCSEDIEEAIAQCDALSSTQGKKLFLSQFHLTLSDFVRENPNLVSPKEQSNYLTTANDIISSCVCQAYACLGDRLLILKEENVSRKNLKERNLTDYYSYLLKNKTGSDRSVEEIETLLQSRFSALACEYNELLSSVDTSAFDIKAFPVNKETAAKEMLDTLMQRTNQDFPSLPSSIGYHIKSVPKTLENYTAPAYYFSPQLDCYTENKIYINNAQITDALSLFTTLAHEGYPGHMLQTTYFYDYCAKNKLSTQDLVLYHSVDYPGYVEGWAMYVELFSFSYASDYVVPKKKDATQEDIKKYLTFLRLNRELKICLYCLLDLRVNIYGDQSYQLVPYLQNIGITDTGYSSALYRYLTNEPATYASYYIGYLELLDCLSYYNNQCDKYKHPKSLKEFHTLYLQAGPCSFSLLKEQIHSFVCTKNSAIQK